MARSNLTAGEPNLLNCHEDNFLMKAFHSIYTFILYVVVIPCNDKNATTSKCQKVNFDYSKNVVEPYNQANTIVE